MDLVLSVAPGVLVFGEGRAASTSMHRHPVVKVVLSLDGKLGWRWQSSMGTRTSTGAGVLIPLESEHQILTAGPYVAVAAEPWLPGLPRLPHGSTPLGLDDRLCHRLVCEVGRLAEAAVPAEVLIGTGQALFSRIRLALDLSARSPIRDDVRTVAEALGSARELRGLGSTVHLSATRLREVFRGELGVTMGRLRTWQRLVAVGEDSPWPLAQRSVRAGFSDQAHMTRSATAIVGRTPAEVVRAIENDPTTTGKH